jgi:hypothetical protein
MINLQTIDIFKKIKAKFGIFDSVCGFCSFCFWVGFTWKNIKLQVLNADIKILKKYFSTFSSKKYF